MIAVSSNEVVIERLPEQLGLDANRMQIMKVQLVFLLLSSYIDLEFFV